MHKIPQTSYVCARKNIYLLIKHDQQQLNMIFENPRIFLLNKIKVNKFEEQVIFFSQIIWEI